MKKAEKVWINRGAWLLFIIYIAALAYFLFFSEHYGRDRLNANYDYNLQLFKSIKLYIRYRELVGMESFVVNLFGNVLAFAPFGFMLPIISPKNRKFLNVALLSLELTLTVEILQFLLKVGIFDVDDIFLNFIGGILGYFLYSICLYLSRGKKKR